ncbi:hypothetical protein ACOME3_000262 [Neoechinorhynchus agilis]
MQQPVHPGSLNKGAKRVHFNENVEVINEIRIEHPFDDKVKYVVTRTTQNLREEKEISNTRRTSLTRWGPPDTPFSRPTDNALMLTSHFSRNHLFIAITSKDTADCMALNETGISPYREHLINQNIRSYDKVTERIVYQTDHVEIDIKFGSNHFVIFSQIITTGRVVILKNGIVRDYDKSIVNGFIDAFVGHFEGIIHLNDTFSFFVESSTLVGLTDKGTIAYSEEVHKDAIGNKTCGLSANYTDPRPRFKRRILNYIPFPGNRSTCNLFIRSDVEYYNLIYNTNGHKDHGATITNIIASFEIMVNELNVIYKDVEFRTSRGIYKGLNFRIKRLRIMEPKDCEDISPEALQKDPEKLLCQTNMDIMGFLSAHTRGDFSDYCLAYTFTAREFEGTLGLAYMSEKDRLGGICGGRMKGTSSNTGVVTLNFQLPLIVCLNLKTFDCIISQNRRVSQVTAISTFAHEVGHNLGAPHDPEIAICSPDGPKGKYLMHPQSSVGYLLNNRRLSPCSLEHISLMMDRVMKNELNCLVTAADGYCGNRIIDKNEVCDCGFEDQCNERFDKCCYPADYPVIAKRCTLKDNAVCSPSMGPCCSSKTCNFFEKNEICEKQTDECRKDGFCQGNSSKCQQRTENKVASGTLCAGDTATCVNGQCIGSLCAHFGLEPCSPDSINIRTASISERLALCHVHCIVDNRCIDSFDFKESMSHCQKSPINCTQGFVMRTGSACASGGGFCDIFQMCRIMDHVRAFDKLRDVVSKKLDPIKKNWTVFMISVFAAFLVSAILVKIFTRSSIVRRARRGNRVAMRTPADSKGTD